MADSEVRQKELMTLELKAMIRKIETFRTSLPDKLRIMQRFYDAVFEAGMRAGEIARWIPVEEKSPEIARTWTDCGNVYRQSDELLIFDSVVGRRTGCFYGPGWSGSEGDKLTSVTHWQPLPAAPEEKKP